MAILDPENIPFQIKDQIEAAANDLGKGLVWASHPGYPEEPANDDPRVILLSQGVQGALTALAMLIL